MQIPEIWYSLLISSLRTFYNTNRMGLSHFPYTLPLGSVTQRLLQLMTLVITSGVGAHDKWGGPVASLMKNGGVSRPIGHRTNIVSVKKWGGQSPPKPPCSDSYGHYNLCFKSLNFPQDPVFLISQSWLFYFLNLDLSGI